MLREEAREWLLQIKDRIRGGDEEFDARRHEALDMAIEALSAEAVQVVRCKDCRFSETYQNDSSGVMALYCKAFTLQRMVADDNYCSYGERREDGE